MLGCRQFSSASQIVYRDLNKVNDQHSPANKLQRGPEPEPFYGGRVMPALKSTLWAILCWVTFTYSSDVLVLQSHPGYQKKKLQVDILSSFRTYVWMALHWKSRESKCSYFFFWGIMKYLGYKSVIDRSIMFELINIIDKNI